MDCPSSCYKYLELNSKSVRQQGAPILARLSRLHTSCADIAVHRNQIGSSRNEDGIDKDHNHETQQNIISYRGKYVFIYYPVHICAEV
jgi:hypothetical protein